MTSRMTLIVLFLVFLASRNPSSFVMGRETIREQLPPQQKNKEEGACLEMSADGTVGECLANDTSESSSSDSADTSTLTYPSAQEEADMFENLIKWIRDNGGAIDERQVVRRDIPGDPASPRKVYATANIPKNTELCRVPWKLILSPQDPEETNLCELVQVTKTELSKYQQEGDEQSTFFSPYMRVLDSLAQHMVLPDGWSTAGKQLLNTVLGDQLPPRDVNSHIQWYENACGGDSKNDPLGLKAALLVIGYRSNGFLTPSQTNTYQEVMMPFYDLYSHRDGYYYNTQLTNINAGQDIVIAASRNIEKGESIHGSVGFGTPLGTPRLFRDGGFVEQVPQEFYFELKDGHETHTVMFDLVEDDEEKDEGDTDDESLSYVVQWPNGRPANPKAFDALKTEFERLEALQDVLQPNATYMSVVPKYERDLVAQYHSALLTAIRHAMAAHDTGPYGWSPFTQTDYVVAGVNLGEYGLSTDDEKDEVDVVPPQTDEPPFELFEDFDISHLIQGHEGWQQILDYRNTLERPSLSFYVDKVARKRWLPTQGFDEPNIFAMYYGEELTDSGDLQDEEEAIYQLLPNETDYAAKPTHFSETNGIWIVSKDLETNQTIVSSTARQLVPDEENKFDNRVVAKSLAKNLHSVAKPHESWALKNVKPGFVVEERFVDFDRWDRPPLELCIFVIWGRVWVGQMNYIEEQHRFFGAFIYRNGTTVKGSFHKKIPFQWLDWPRLVEYAETLGANKDMFRADFFVGAPATSPSLKNGTYEEKVADLRYVVSESEIYPTTTFHSDSLPADAARLWVAGYKIGNYKVVPNTEVPKEFLETGKIAAKQDKKK